MSVCIKERIISSPVRISGGERAAAIYTLVQTAKLNALNPETYLRDILTKIAEGHTINRIDELVPWRMIPATATSSP